MFWPVLMFAAQVLHLQARVGLLNEANNLFVGKSALFHIRHFL
jgi:hypothetical protein